MEALRRVEEEAQVNNIINQIQYGRKVKTFKNRENPFELYSDQEFRAKYRFSQSGAMFIEELTNHSLTLDKRGGGISSTLQILIALRYWGHNQIQDDAADIHGMIQQSITTVCRRVARAILEKRFDHIKMPISLDEQVNVMQQFHDLAGLKKVIGAIDCTQIRVQKIQGPSGQFYINHKGYSSLNVQIVLELMKVDYLWKDKH